MSLSAYAQHTVVVNPDGTHSVAIQTGSNITVVNPDGSHSTGIQTGNIITVVNPDGTHSTGILTGSSTTIVNPNGTHTTVIENGNDKTIALNKDSLDRVVVSAICAEPANIIRAGTSRSKSSISPFIRNIGNPDRPWRRLFMEKALICVLMSSAFKIRRPFLSRKNK